MLIEVRTAGFSGRFGEFGLDMRLERTFAPLSLTRLSICISCFRGILCGNDTEKLDVWLHDADRSGLYGIRLFARTLRQDLAAVRNAITETWSNSQTEGQINRLKTLKRAMYGSAGIELLRARMLRIRRIEPHAD